MGSWRSAFCAFLLGSAVLAAQPCATIDRMETEADGAEYEAHVTLADGSDATVKLDANYTVTVAETGHR